MKNPWRSWIGEEVAIEFNLDPCMWPISGGRVIIDAVDMPLILMHSTFGGRPMWVNAGDIRTVTK